MSLTEGEESISGTFWDQNEFLAYVHHKGSETTNKSIIWSSYSFSRLWWQLAVVNSSQGLQENALLCLGKGLEVEPDQPQLWIERGYILNKVGRRAEALAAYQAAVSIRAWAAPAVVARALRGQGSSLIDLRRFAEARTAYQQSLELAPGNSVAEKELEYIDQALKDESERSKAMPWFLHCVKFPPTDPLTIQLVALVDGLESIPGPKTVGPENYSRISGAFYERGWAGFEQAFDAVVPRDRADYADLKRNLLREPIFMLRVHHRMARLYLGKATIEEVLEEVDMGKTPGKPQ